MKAHSTLSCRLPLGKELLYLIGFVKLGQAVAKPLVAEELRQFREYLQMFLGGLFRREQYEDMRNGLAVRGIEGNGRSYAHEGCRRGLKTLYAAVWNSYTLPQPSR